MRKEEGEGKELLFGIKGRGETITYSGFTEDRERGATKGFSQLFKTNSSPVSGMKRKERANDERTKAVS